MKGRVGTATGIVPFKQMRGSLCGGCKWYRGRKCIIHQWAQTCSKYEKKVNKRKKND